MSNKEKVIIKSVVFLIYILCLVISVVVSIVKTNDWFNIIPIIALVGAFSCSVDESVKIYKELKDLFSTRDN